MDSIPDWHLLCKTGKPTWGELGTDLLRVSPVASADGIIAPSTESRSRFG
jgi:hypothetical protein